MSALTEAIGLAFDAAAGAAEEAANDVSLAPEVSREFRKSSEEFRGHETLLKRYAPGFFG